MLKPLNQDSVECTEGEKGPDLGLRPWLDPLSHRLDLAGCWCSPVLVDSVAQEVDLPGSNLALQVVAEHVVLL